MSEQLNDEQVEFLTEFMEWHLCTHNHTANDREAVMDRAVKKGYWWMEFNHGHSDKVVCTIEHKSTGEHDRGIKGNGPTRFIALVNALMEAER